MVYNHIDGFIHGSLYDLDDQDNYAQAAGYKGKDNVGLIAVL
jgi:hypothetical protein